MRTWCSNEITLRFPRSAGRLKPIATRAGKRLEEESGVHGRSFRGLVEIEQTSSGTRALTQARCPKSSAPRF
jgi:hypothetical protein